MGAIKAQTGRIYHFTATFKREAADELGVFLKDLDGGDDVLVAQGYVNVIVDPRKKGSVPGAGNSSTAGPGLQAEVLHKEEDDLGRQG